MGPDRAGAVREAAAQAEVHAARDILGGPARGAVRRDGADGGGEGAVGVGGALPRVALVEMRVEIHEARPDLAAVEGYPRGIGGGGPGGRDARDDRAHDLEVGPGQTLA